MFGSSVSLVSVMRLLPVPNLIVSSVLSQRIRRMMGDHKFGLMLAAALDAIHAGERDGKVWRSCLLADGCFLVLDNNGGDWTFIWHVPHACKEHLHDEMAAPSETPKASQQSIQKKRVAGPEKYEVPEKSDAFEGSVQDYNFRNHTSSTHVMEKCSPLAHGLLTHTLLGRLVTCKDGIDRASKHHAEVRMVH